MKTRGRKVFAVLLSLALCVGLLPTAALAAEGEVAIDAAHFPDNNFRAAVKEYDPNGDGKFTKTERNAVRTMKVNKKNIASLRGIEYFPNLTELDCSSNQLTELDVTPLPNLVYLYCTHNQISQLDVGSNPKLYHLYCEDNRLTNLDVSQNPELRQLFCDENQIESLYLANNPNLCDLTCTNNQLAGLDVRKNTQLDFLRFQRNQITVKVAEDRTVDLVYNTPPSFEPDYMVPYPDADQFTIHGTVMTVKEGLTQITYRYQIGKDSLNTALFTWVLQPEKNPVSVFVQGGYGTVTADKTTAKAGETVTLTVTAQQGYVLDELQVMDEGAGNVPYDTASRTFTMPDMAVNVNATFKPAASREGTVAVTGVTAPVAGQTPSFAWTIPAGYEKKADRYTGSTSYWVETDTAPTSMNQLLAGDRIGEDSPEPFQPGKVYTFVGTLNGAGLGDGIAATVNGQTAKVYHASDTFGETCYVTCSFPLAGQGTVQVLPSPNGTVTTNVTAAGEGDTVVVIATPNAGYTYDDRFDVVVLDKNGQRVPCKDNLFTMPAGNVTVQVNFTKTGPDAKNPFTDVKDGDYFKDAVLWAVDKKVTSGTTATTFGPNSPCTRGQAVTFLWRANGSPTVSGTNPFSDVKSSDYFYQAVLWAVEKGITNGTGPTTFSPDASCTRGQIVTFLHRSAGSPAAAGTVMSDVPATAYFAAPVRWAVSKGITNGTSPTTFSTDNTCTRGQIVTFIYRQMK